MVTIKTQQLESVAYHLCQVLKLVGHPSVTRRRNRQAACKRVTSSKHRNVWSRQHRRKDGTLIRSYVAEYNLGVHSPTKKKTKTFSVEKHGEQAEDLAAQWLIDQRRACAV